MRVLFTAILLAAPIAHTFSQRDPSREIIVYFRSGVRIEPVRQALNEEKHTVALSSRLKGELDRLQIAERNIQSVDPVFNESDTIKVLEDGTKLARINMKKLFRINVDASQDRQSIIDALNRMPEVVYAESNGFVANHVTPSDSIYQYQWHLKNNSINGADIHAEAAWSTYTGNPNNIIGIIDFGIDANHVDLNDKLAGGDLGYSISHGTRVGGIAAAESNNVGGVAGVDWSARIHSQRIDGADDIGVYTAIVDAVNYNQNVHILNNSWGLSQGYDQNGNPIPGRFSITVRQAFAYAYKANRTSVASMGNDQETYPNVIGYPAGFDGVIAVGSTTIFDQISSTSSQGNHIDVSAPGVGILTTDLNGGYYPASGTSMAAPIVSGIASLLKGYKPELANDDIENLIRLSADDKGAPGFDQVYGAGRVNAERALNYLKPPYNFNQWTQTGGTNFSTTNSYVMQILGASGLASANYIVKRHEVRKSVTFPKSFCQLTGAWGRGVSSSGWRAASPNYGEGFCEVVPGTLTNTGAILRTYVYEVSTMLGQYIGYYPSTPGNATFAYTVLGIENPEMPVIAPNVVCTTGQFSLQPVPSGYTASWSTWPPNRFTPSSGTGGTASFSVNDPNTFGTAQITFTVQGLCGNVSKVLPFWVGRPAGIIDGPWSVYPDQVYQYTANSLGGPYAFLWSIGGSGYNWGWSDTQPLVFVYWTSSGTEGTVNLASENACGTTFSSLNVTITQEGGCNPCQIVTPSPNPASMEFDISIIDLKPKSKNEKERTYELRLINNTMETVFSTSIQGLTTKIPIGNLPNGLYYVRVVGQDGEMTTTQVQILR